MLRTVFGHSQFRPKQEEIITSVLENRDVLAVLPTGGGKSLCYQIPALCKEGICIVVSPLIALINDQITQLQKRNVRAVGITSGISRQDLDTVLDNCIYGNYKFLYLSPERLEQPLVQERISQMKVNLLAIDEAHCISEWGHDFRPAYLKIKEVFSFINKAPVIAVTATATVNVQEDIKEHLNLKNPRVFTSSFERRQLNYDLEHSTHKRSALINFYNNSQGSSIAYVRSRKNTVEFSQLLSHKNISSSAYHGGLDSKMRKDLVSKWLSNQTRVMVATNAFGMGIDKPDVRSVVHLQLPDSIESYYQETGRAGRDGKTGIAKFIYNENDVIHARNQFIRALPTVDILKKTYRHLSNYLRIAYGEGQEHTYQLPFADFCRTYDLNGIITYNALTALDRFGVISLDQSYGNRSVVRFRESGTKIMDFTSHDQVAHAIVQAILRSYGSSREQNLQINSKLIAVRSNTTEKEVTETLKQLHERELIYARITGTDLTLQYLQPREDDRTINRFARELERYNEVRIQKLNAMIELLDQNQCMERGILAYFGERLDQNCGRCTYCRKGKMVNLKLMIEQYVSQGEVSLEEISNHVNAPKDEILKTLRQLIDDGIILNIAGKAFRINER
ncbi:RecQ family ATP-dependent DNA helicase [Nonlabens spongiae]|uniref:RecQ family ATP-dependent DNA helicase n=1 Tax=Nonlabens spongiae TaxID=331648 RepID=UPI001FE4B2BD|nr:RecQ family ATP-dependent DNA helicase [Nonlabens spongiae]